MKTFKKTSLIGAFTFISVIWIGLYKQPENKKRITQAGDTERINTLLPFHSIKPETHSRYKKHISVYAGDIN